MELILNITFGVFILGVIYLIYIKLRNNKVCNFLIEVHKEIYWYNIRVDYKNQLDYPYTDEIYEKMLCSFKPLRMDIWFPELHRKIMKKKFNEIINEED